MSLLDEQKRHRERMATIASAAETGRLKAVKAAAKLKAAIEASMAEKRSKADQNEGHRQRRNTSRAHEPHGRQSETRAVRTFFLLSGAQPLLVPRQRHRATSAERRPSAPSAGRPAELRLSAERDSKPIAAPSWQKRRERAVEQQRQEVERRREALRQRSESRAAEALKRMRQRQRTAHARNLALVVAWEAEESAPSPAPLQCTPPVLAARPQSASCAHNSPFGRGAMASLLANDLVSLTRRLGGNVLATRVLTRPPPVLPIPSETLAEMRTSLKLVRQRVPHQLEGGAARADAQPTPGGSGG